MVNDLGDYGNIIDGGTGIAPTINEIASTVVRLCNSSSKLVHVPMRKGEETLSTVVADTNTLKPIGMEKHTFVTLEEGIKQTIPYYKDYISKE